MNFEALQRPFRERPFAKAADAPRCCMAPGCAAGGDYRAPMSRDRLNEYYWFCLDHVRIYNATWDYYKGLDPEAIERELRQDATWRRPSWPLGLGASLHDPLGMLGGDGPQGRQERAAQASSPEAKALAVLELPSGSSFDEVKTRYKALVKLLHPDANGGDRLAEERLKIVNQAYGTLKTAYAQTTYAKTA